MLIGHSLAQEYEVRSSTKAKTLDFSFTSTFYFPDVINMYLLPTIPIGHPAIGLWEHSTQTYQV